MQLFWDGFVGAWQLVLQRDPLVLDAAWRSLWISLAAVLAAGAIGVPCGSLLAQARFRGRGILVTLFRAGMSVPTVLIGLLAFALLSRRGTLGGLDLLYTPWAILLGELCLAIPIVVSWTHSAVSGLDRRVTETAVTLGAGPIRRWLTLVSEARLGIALALFTALGRCLTELGIAMMVGGNLKFRTRTLTTATALESSKGEFARGVAMSLILLAMALLITLVVAWVSRDERER